MIDERVMHDAVRNVNHAVGIQLEQPELGRTQPASNGEPCAVPEACGRTCNYRHLRQAMVTCEPIQGCMSRWSNIALTEAWAAWTRRPMRTGQ
jgi:hypothetical protein